MFTFLGFVNAKDVYKLDAQMFITGSNEDLSFNLYNYNIESITIDGNLINIMEVDSNNNPIDETGECYKVNDNFLYIKASYLDTLSEGSHDVFITTNDHDYEFIIVVVNCTFLFTETEIVFC